MFSLNEEELKQFTNDVKTLQLQLQHIENFASKIRAKSQTTNPIQLADKNIFEQNLEIILSIQNTPHFKESVIQYFLNNLFKPNISFYDIINHTSTPAYKLYSKQQREIKLSAALITQIVIKTHPNFPYSVAQIIVSFIQIDYEIKECKSSLKINDDVQLLFSKMRHNKDFSNALYNMFIRVDRKLFVPEHEKEECNSYDRPISLNYGVSLSAPHIHVHALKQFEYLLSISNDGESCVTFLDVGCGTGYVCTLMAVGMVLNNTNESYFKSYGCIYNPHLLLQAMEARDMLNLLPFLELKHSSVDMNDIGWMEKAPFDGIYCGAAIKGSDAVLLREQLKIGGYLMCVVEHPDSAAKQVMKLIKRVKKTDFSGVSEKCETKEQKEEDTKEEEKIVVAENDKNTDNGEEDNKNKENDNFPDDFDGLKAMPTRKLTEYLRSRQIDPKSAEFHCIEKDDIINLVLRIQNAMNAFEIEDATQEEKKDELEDEKKEECEKEKENKLKVNSNDADFEVTELFDVRFRTLRGRFQYLKNEESLISDSDSDESD